ncbi:2'-5' RNA ligase [Thermodesulfobium narugense DSM 14796]|uniref:RNA 2',3'-cyclic phosphodiesterase n=1 Tax=Thermodesulfobium narugense DSM 14796 TaxID=747365 RepID=M1E571_9BACT|nr:RNA 2',3'-cyclic phosphodiesterase [Thermodesulfobium narugense]AEE14857.1 2'-5' RNA ligase [Thermodesulfobium narugense DSM 14796]
MRLFIAYKIHNKDAKDIYLNVMNCEAFKKHKIVDSKNYHITFKFLGETKLDIQLISERLLESLYNVKRFSFFFSNEIGYMPSRHNPKLAYLKIYEKDSKFEEVFRNVDLGMSNLGFEMEKREFKPHLTLVRFREALLDDDIFPIYFKGKSRTESIMDKVSLFQSILMPDGPIYKEVFSVKL